MIVNKTNLQAAAKGYRAVFFSELEKRQGEMLYPKLAMVTPSNNSQETYNWLTALPSVREWIGDRHIHKLAAEGFTIVNREYESTIAVMRTEMADDKLGIVRPRIMDLAGLAAEHPDDLIISLIDNGFSGTGFDGKAFFATNHDGPTGSKSNKGTAVLSAENYAAARAEMQSLKVATPGGGTRSLKVRTTHLLCPPALEKTAKEILNAEIIGNNSNVMRGTAELIIDPRLTSDTAWFLLDLSRSGLKPLIFQDREKVEFTAMDSPDDEAAFMKNEFRYGTYARYGAGYGFWYLAWGSTGLGA